MRWIGAVLVVLLASGCASTGRPLSCEGPWREANLAARCAAGEAGLDCSQVQR